MTFHSHSRAFALALLLCASLSAPTSAQNAPAAVQEPAPKPDAGTSAQAACIAENDGYKMVGKTPTFFIELENKCAQRLACRVYAYVTSAKGATQGHGSLLLAPRAHDANGKGTFTMRVKLMGGSSQSTRECRVF